MVNTDVKISEVIPRHDTEVFLSGINYALQENLPSGISDLYLFIPQRNAIAISFDSNWRPFIGTTMGYNCQEERTYLGGGAFLALVKSRFRACPHEIPGGRVFLTSSKAYPANGMPGEAFINWIWLSDSGSLVEDVRKQLRRYSRFT